MTPTPDPATGSDTPDTDAPHPHPAPETDAAEPSTPHPDPADGSDRAGVGCVSGRSPQGAERTTAAPTNPEPRSAPEETPRRAPDPTRAATPEPDPGAGSDAAEPSTTQPDPADGSDPAGVGCVPGRSPQGAERTTAAPTNPEPRSAPEETPRRAPDPTPFPGTTAKATPAEPHPTPATGSAHPDPAQPGTAPTGPTQPGPAAQPGTAPTGPAQPGTAPTGPAQPGNAAQTGSANPAPANPRHRFRRARLATALTAVLAAGALLLAVLNAGTRHGHLDPRSADPTGTLAVAELLKARGVTTRVVTTAREAAEATGPRTTLLVTDPDRLGPHQRRAIRSAMDLSGGRTVLLAPGTPSLPDLSPGVQTATTADTDTDTDTPVPPSCPLPAAESAGPATTTGHLAYTTALPGTTACYPPTKSTATKGTPGHPTATPPTTPTTPATLLVLPSTTPGGDTVLLGSETILLNESLAEQGNASLALQLLGTRPDLVWYLPSLADSDPDTGSADDKSLLELVPAGWSWALLQLFVAAALAALWRARRLGPLVTERLPVAIRASEATEGRARLYRKAGARDRAATVLRAATRERLAALLGVPPTRAHDPAALLPPVSARLSGEQHTYGDPTALLFGPAPSDDAALVALADHLDALEREVRTS